MAQTASAPIATRADRASSVCPQLMPPRTDLGSQRLRRSHELDIGVTCRDGSGRSGVGDGFSCNASIRLINYILADDQFAAANQDTIRESS